MSIDFSPNSVNEKLCGKKVAKLLENRPEFSVYGYTIPSAAGTRVFDSQPVMKRG